MAEGDEGMKDGDMDPPEGGPGIESAAAEAGTVAYRSADRSGRQ